MTTDCRFTDPAIARARSSKQAVSRKQSSCECGMAPMGFRTESIVILPVYLRKIDRRSPGIDRRFANIDCRSPDIDLRFANIDRCRENDARCWQNDRENDDRCWQNDNRCREIDIRIAIHVAPHALHACSTW